MRGNLNSGNLPYLVANIYDLNFIKSEVFQSSGGQKPIRVVYNNQKKLKFWESALIRG